MQIMLPKTIQIMKRVKRNKKYWKKHADHCHSMLNSRYMQDEKKFYFEEQLRNCMSNLKKK